MKHIIFSILDRFKTTSEGQMVFRGTYNEGKAVYSYIPSEEDGHHIFNGSFMIRYQYGRGKYAKAKGSYKNDVKQGHWEFIRHGFTTSRSLSAGFVDGQIEGTLECMYKKEGVSWIDNSKFQLTVHQGKITGDVKGILNNKEIPANFRDDPKLVCELEFILDEVVSVLLSLAPKGHMLHVFSFPNDTTPLSLK